MNGMEQVRTPETVAAEIRALTASMLNDVIEIGRRMTEVKEMLPHGSFGEWIRENTGYSSSTANNFMQLYREYGEAQSSLFGTGAKSQTIGNLSYSKALALLSVPAEERESFAEEADAEHITVRELKEKIEEREKEMAVLSSDLKLEQDANAHAKEIIEELQQKQERSVQKLIDAEKQLQELRKKPVEVAVEKVDASEEQIAQAKKEAAAEWEKTVKELKEKEKKKREALSEQLQAAEKALEEEKGKSQDAALAAEVETLRKKLSMSSPEMTEFRLRFSAWQESYAAMREALQRVPEEQRDRCEAAVKAVLKNWGE